MDTFAWQPGTVKVHSGRYTLSVFRPGLQVSNKAEARYCVVLNVLPLMYEVHPPSKAFLNTSSEYLPLSL
jgi:hypothetical protein